MPDVLIAILVLWGFLGALATLVGLGIAWSADYDDVEERMLGYRVALTGLLAPVAIPFWVGYFGRLVVLDYLRTRAELRELDSIESDR